MISLTLVIAFYSVTIILVYTQNISETDIKLLCNIHVCTCIPLLRLLAIFSFNKLL